MNKKFLKFILSIFLIISVFNIGLKIYRMNREKKIIDELYEIFRLNYNFTFDKTRYKGVFDNSPLFPGHIIRMKDYYFIKLKDNYKIQYRSEYIRRFEKEYGTGDFLINIEDSLASDMRIEINNSFFNRKYSEVFLRMIKRYGFLPYVLNDLLYDKSKGNNFEEIEKVFKKYEEKYPTRKIYYQEDNLSWRCGTVESHSDLGNTALFVPDEKCETETAGYGVYYIISYSDEEVEKYSYELEKYFSEARKLEEMDWYEFKTRNNLYPIVKFYVERGEKEELEEMRDEIKKHYNDKELVIVLVSYPNKELRVW